MVRLGLIEATIKIHKLKKLIIPSERTAMYSLDLTPPNGPATNVNADLKQGIQLSQIGEESRKVYEATTEVRNRLEPSNIINPLQSYNLSPIFS